MKTRTIKKTTTIIMGIGMMLTLFLGFVAFGPNTQSRTYAYSVRASVVFNDTVNLEVLKEKGLLAKKVNYFKVLARGELNKSLTIEANEFSIEAIKMIVLTGGKVIKLS